MSRGTYIRTEEIRRKQSDSHKGIIPWNKDKKGVQIAWNKDLKTGPLSDEHRRNISAGNKGISRNKGIILSKEHKKRIGENNAKYWLDKKFSEDHKSKISVSKIGKLCGIENPNYGNRWKKSEETKQKHREKTILQHLNHSGPYKDTKPELKMKEILNELNIPFEHQFRVENHLYDFHISNTNILIEVDGDYWHGNPKKFSNLNKYQLKQKEIDLKNEQLAKEREFILIRFWEHDILHNTEKIKDEIKNLKEV